MKKNGIFSTSHTDSRIRLCTRANYLRYVEGKHQGHQIAFSEILYWLEKNDFAEFNVHLIHSKQVPFLDNTLLILCYEGAEL